jgi:uncharacterized membrane-anchored protein YjiN (DUF445 family)
MIRVIFFSLAIILIFSAANSAQSKPTRFAKQHNSHFLKEHLDKTEKMLLKSLQSNNANMVSSSVQTIRELEQVFPDEAFSSFINPLSKIVQDENSDTHARILSALALDELHSDFGDKAIYEIAKNSSNQSVKDICSALAIESFKADEKNLSSK